MKKGTKAGVTVFILILLGLGGWAYYTIINEKPEIKEQDPNFVSEMVFSREGTSNIMDTIVDYEMDNIINGSNQETEGMRYYYSKLTDYGAEAFDFYSIDQGGFYSMISEDNYYTPDHYISDVEQFTKMFFELDIKSKQSLKSIRIGNSIQELELAELIVGDELSSSTESQEEHMKDYVNYIVDNRVKTECNIVPISCCLYVCFPEDDYYTCPTYIYTYLLEIECLRNNDENPVAFPKVGETKEYVFSLALTHSYPNDDHCQIDQMSISEIIN